MLVKKTYFGNFFNRIDATSSRQENLKPNAADITLTIDQCRMCKPINRNYANSVCQTKDILAAKTIRLYSSDEVKEIIQEITDLKILITFRDPRGTYLSRKKVLENKEVFRKSLRAFKMTQ